MNEWCALPIPYTDELLYSVISRYHLRSNNTSPKWTLREVFGTDNVIPTIDLPSHLDALSRRSVSQALSVDEWINRHTFYPYYAPFLPAKRAERVKGLMRSVDGSGIHALVGITASTIDRSDRLLLCPSCYDQDIQSFGEPYWHRIHQLPGVYFCLHHRRILHKLTDPLSNRHGLNVLPISRHMFRSTPVIEVLPDKLINRLSDIAEDIYLLVQQDELLALYDLRQVIHPRLAEKGYVTVASHIRQQKLCEQLVLFYSRELLDLLDSDPTESSYTWLEQSTRTARRVIHPLRQLLLIRFLFGSFREFLDRTDGINAPFGKDPWPCLNKAADHYMKLVVTQCDITRCSDTGRPVGTFMCSCGFSYSRRGPDRTEVDKFYRGRIKSFGSVWSDKLNQCIREGLSYRAAAEMLGVNTNTVIKYANGKLTERDVPLKPKHAKRARTASPSISSRNSLFIRVDWERRDLELSWEVEQECKAIMADFISKPIRITIALIGKRIGRLSWLEKNQHKLPVTMSILSIYIESVSQFQIRRVRWATERFSGEWPIKRWKLEKLAGLRSDYSQEVSGEIERCIGQSRLLPLFTSSEEISSWQH
ncbi:hypothetical protein PAECIP111893_03079 [Paenibacillus plantiphilus]|uniref:Transposon Tn7 transposition protein TnsD C-termianl domain-containing protein n=1 Tax=Paenibacillus plantiphilus TaxID=2905650 RepID=A0ABN8GHY6_9BACL|nr:TnsD family Tn7-like transposition protein [Paenibacillus plantiphilus]CAH1209625.1 hypothetical protein PAECIP111893_03079 [Paenibacillus plantiphilus]